MTTSASPLGPPCSPWPALEVDPAIYAHGQPRSSGGTPPPPLLPRTRIASWDGEARALHAPPSPPWPPMYDDPYRVRHGEPRTRANVIDYLPIFPRMGAQRP